MNIVFISDQYFPRTSADTEQIISSLSALSKITDVTLITPSNKSKKVVTTSDLEEYYGRTCNFKLESIPVANIYFRGLEKLIVALKSALSLRNKDIDFIYTRNIPVIIFSILITNHKIVFESYRPWPERNVFSKLFFKYMAKNLRFIGVILHSNFAGNSFRNVGFIEKDLLVAHNAFDFSIYEEESKSTVRTKYNLPQNKLIVTYSGRVNINKGLDRMLLLAKQYPDIFFLIVGSEQEGEIENQAKDYSNVKVLGWMSRTEVFSILTSSDILYIPTTLRAREVSKNTVLPIKTFIYKASGTAIFAPQSEDLIEVLQHKENAYLVEPDNWESENNGFLELISDDGIRNKLGQNAKADMMNNTWDNRASRIYNFLDLH